MPAFDLGAVFTADPQTLPGAALCCTGGICRYAGRGFGIGFIHVEAGPLVRSSYHAEEQFKEVINAEGK